MLRLVAILIFTVLLPRSALAEEQAACAIHFEGKYEIRPELEELGCKKGDALLFYNVASTARWKTLLPIRVAALSVCDMSMPITDSSTFGSQFVMCTYSGSFRQVKGEKKHMKGFAGGIKD